jgi:hypothetical protein
MTGAIGQLPGITNKGDITIEARIKVLQSSGRRGFSMIYLDGKGSTALFLSPDKAELAPGMKNVGWRDVGFQSSSLDTTDRFHTYRIVRPANSMYSYLYIDDNPIPAVYDQHADGHMGSLFLPQPVIEFGAGAHPDPWRSTTNVQIEYIRWAPTAYAPPAP